MMDAAVLAACLVSAVVGLAAGGGGVATLWLITSLRASQARQDAALELEHRGLIARESDQ